MTFRWKLAGALAGLLVILAVVLVVGGIYIAKSAWLREQVRERIVSTLETATGGRVELKAFQFDWSTMTAEVDDLVLHGTEPSPGPALLRIPKLVIGLKIISLVKRSVDVASVRVENPQVYLLVAPDGSTNVPQPKVPVKTDKPITQTILDLKVGEFALLNASEEVHAAGQAPKVVSYDLTGQRLQSRMTYSTAGPSYRGSFSVDPLTVRYSDTRSTNVTASLNLTIEKNRLQVSDAKLATSSSRITLDGLVDNFTTPVVTAKFEGEVSLNELNSILKQKQSATGTVHLAGDARYASATDYRLTGTVDSRNLRLVQGDVKLAGIRVSSAVQLGPESLELSKLSINALGGALTGRATLRKFDQFEATGDLHNFQASVLAALGTTEKLPYDGIVKGPFQLKGRLSDKDLRSLVASAQLTISPAPSGLPVTGRVTAKLNGASNEIILDPSSVILPNTRLDVSGALGRRLQVVAQSRNLDDLSPLLAYTDQKTLPFGLQKDPNPGLIRFEGTVTGPLNSPRVDGHVTAQNVIYLDQTIAALSGDLTLQETGASVSNAAVVYQNVRSSFQFSVGLRAWKPENDRPVSGSANLQNASVADLLRLAGRKDIPVAGTLTATTQIAGTVGDIHASANVTLLNGSAYDEPYDRITGKLDYQNGNSETAVVQWKSGSRQIDANARYQHLPNDWQTGQLHFDLTTNQVAVNQFAWVKKNQPAVKGNVTATAKGDVAINKGVLKIGAVDADARATSLAYDTHSLGNAHLTVHSDGQTLKAHVESNLAQADIKGDGSWRMTGDYPGSAEVTFARVDLAAVRRTFSTPKTEQSVDFTGSTVGKLSLSGPLLKPEAMNGTLEIPQIEVRPGTVTALAKEISDATLQNIEPIRINMNDSVIRVESARFRALNTDLALLGSVDLKQKSALNLNLNGRADLHLLRTFNPDIESSGSLLVRVTVRGSLDSPRLGGTADLRNGNISMAGIPNGLSGANGRISFDENRANIENLSATTGGGTIRLDGFAAFGGPLVSFHLTGVAKGVRVRYPEGVSSVSDANLNWTGTTDRSVVGGDITVQKVTYNPQSDLSSILAMGNGPAAVQASPTGLLAGIQFDVRVQTAPGITFQTGLVTGLETEANLRLKGTYSNPALLGRINVNAGSIVFLNNKYVINQGTISFYNPLKIDPILKLDLETEARGVTVTLSVSGPISKLNVTYQSDPPLQFNDIVGLLATGKTPSDPTIAARQGDTSQSWSQVGAAAIVGQAIGNPVAGRLQRFLGVSRLKIDPLLPGLGGAGSGTVGAGAGARLSLEQQITPNIIFDYVVSTNSTNSQIVRVEWTFNKNWSAVIIREENSAFGIDFLYKKRFK
jgi:translocation and assembly module TamB